MKQEWFASWLNVRKEIQELAETENIIVNANVIAESDGFIKIKD